MWFNLLIILGTCAAAVVFGFFVNWIIIKVQKTLRANQSNSMQRGGQTSSTISEDIEAPSLERTSNKANYTFDTQRETNPEPEEDQRLNNMAPEASASITKKEDGDWLNADKEEVPMNVYKQQDDDWLNAENNQSSGEVDKSSLNLPTTMRPEIQIEQDGSTINITVTTSLNQDTKPEKKEEIGRLKADPEEIPISVYKQRDDDWLNAEDDQPLDTEDASSQNLSTNNQREIQIKQEGFFLNIAVSASKKKDTKSEQTETNLKISPPPRDLPREAELPEDEETTVEDSSPSYQSLPDIVPVKPVEEPVDPNNSLMDEISVRPVESPGERNKKDWELSHVA